MLATRIYVEPHETDPRLVPFGATREEFIEVVRGA
jgi:hypothetical protein